MCSFSIDSCHKRFPNRGFVQRPLSSPPLSLMVPLAATRLFKWTAITWAEVILTQYYHQHCATKDTNNILFMYIIFVGWDRVCLLHSLFIYLFTVITVHCNYYYYHSNQYNDNSDIFSFFSIIMLLLFIHLFSIVTPQNTEILTERVTRPQ